MKCLGDTRIWMQSRRTDRTLDGHLETCRGRSGCRNASYIAVVEFTLCGCLSKRLIVVLRMRKNDEARRQWETRICSLTAWPLVTQGAWTVTLSSLSLPHIAAMLLVRPRWNPTPDLMKAKFNGYIYQYLLAVSIKRSAGGRTWQLPDCQNGRSIKDWFIRYCTLANDTKHSDGSITERGGVPYR
jgi:hypothetical protein